MALRNFTGESGADAAGDHTISLPENTRWVHIDSLTVSTRGADIAADVKIALTDGGKERWIAWLRSGKVFEEHFNDIGKIIINNGGTTPTLGITTSTGGSSVIVVVSAVVDANVVDGSNPYS